MDLTKRLAVPVELMVNEVRTIVQNRVERGGSHGLRVLMGDLDGDFWAKAKTRADGLPDVQWKASADRYSVENLSDGEVDSVLAARLAKTSPAVAGIARNVVTMLEEANSLLSCLSPEDRDGVNTLFSKGSGLDGQLQSSLAAARLVARVAEYRQEHALGRFETVEEAIQAVQENAYPAKTEYVVLTIEETGNAAFVDLGRDQEVARIIDEAADKIASHASIGDADFALRDANGNRVGRVEVTTVTPTGDVPDGTVRLAIETGNAAFEHDANLEVSLLLRGAAEKVRDGEHVFALHDTNGNMVGKFEYREEPSLAKDGVIDMNEALNSGRVYLAEDGWSGIADGEYRFIVTAPDFEPGYGQGEGDVWLVNAKGEIADGYESPQSVRETLFRELNRDEKSDLRAVVEGRVPFEEYERRFEDDDPAP